MDAKTVAKDVLDTLEALLPVAVSVAAIVGGVPVPVLAGMKLASTLLPVADEFIVKIGTKELTLDTRGITTKEQVIEALGTDAGFPELKFKNT